MIKGDIEYRTITRDDVSLDLLFWRDGDIGVRYSNCDLGYPTEYVWNDWFLGLPYKLFFISDRWRLERIIRKMVKRAKRAATDAQTGFSPALKDYPK